ncbi:acyl-CoA dehydrogenase family protein [Georgenia ruanii]|nr:acyl-CoA dehydrogenase family protein [Georgenia ruanii]MPV88459.1 acyl-CoA dehydrogenase [Georgenia ruanii]
MILDDVEGTETRNELADIVTSLFDRVSPPAEVVARADRAAAGHLDLDLWNRLSGEVGVLGLTVPEELDGGGATFAEAAVILELVGRRAAAVPYLGTFLAIEALVRSGATPAREAWLERLMAGESRGALTWAGAGLEARSDDGSWEVTGTVDLVIDGHGADVLVLPARTPDGERWFAVDLAGAGRTRRECLDLTRELAELRLAAAPALTLTEAGDQTLGDVLGDLARTAVAVEQLGVAEQALADAVAYAGVRRQFGRTIGSFQALKHLLADVACEVDLARSLVEHAVWAICCQPDEQGRAAAMAMLAASRAAVVATAESVQVHGGIGFSWEHPAHLYFRKARSNEVLLGARAELADRVLAAEGVRP